MILFLSVWQADAPSAGMSYVRVHDLRHTFGSWLRAAGVSVEDRENLLAHKSNRMTTHYSAAEVSNLIKAANKICRRGDEAPTLTVLRRGNLAYLYQERLKKIEEARSRKSPAVRIKVSRV